MIDIGKNSPLLTAVVQEEPTGCAFASAAALSGRSYKQVKDIANSIGIYAGDPLLWSETVSIRKLLAKLGIKTASAEIPFSNWQSLPDYALLAIKWHLEQGRPFWHWVVFVREAEQAYVLDSKKSLKSHVRSDFGRIKPKWFIEVYRE